MKIHRTLSGPLGATLILSMAAATALADTLTVERIHGDPSLAGPGLIEPRLAPGGAQISLLRGRDDDARQQDLWAFDIESGESRMVVSSTDLLEGPEVLSDEEKNRRERQRIQGRGIVAYDWNHDGTALLFPIGGDVYLHLPENKQTTRVTETPAQETDVRFSPQGRYVSYVRADELYVYDTRRSRERRVTRGADGTVRNAVAEFVAQEEMDRDTGYWWSPDDSRIAFTQIDEAPVAIAERLEFDADKTRTQRQRYPFAGTANVTIRLGVTTPSGGNPVWIDLGPEKDIYLARVYWSADASKLYVERQTRDQKRLDFLEADPRTGATGVLFSETSETWINLHHNFFALKDGGFIRASEKSGYMHLYRHGPDGTATALTEGDWPVKELKCVSEEKDTVYFTGWTESVLETHVFRIPLSSGTPERLSQEEGWHDASFEKSCSRFILTRSHPNQPPQTSVHDGNGKHLAWINENRIEAGHPYYPYLASHEEKVFGTVEAPDGTPLQYELLKPDNVKPGRKLPAVVMVYGGPHAQTVRNGWGRAFEQLLVDEGFVVFRLDNRGSANRGTAFENVLHEHLGTPETEDQVLGARFLGALPYVDETRIGVFGWSYGGYMTLMLMAKAPEIFRAGVSGAPVTDWRLYDTHYTERYMGPPANDAVYEESAVFKHLNGLKGELLLIHGMSDDNVLFQNSIQLMDALQKRGVDFELMTYPGEKHGFRAKANRIHRDRLIVEFFKRKLRTRTYE